eukprot:3538034-Alexandrium_andersonii.AAC.1
MPDVGHRLRRRASRPRGARRHGNEANVPSLQPRRLLLLHLGQGFLLHELQPPQRHADSGRAIVEDDVGAL